MGRMIGLTMITLLMISRLTDPQMRTIRNVVA